MKRPHLLRRTPSHWRRLPTLTRDFPVRLQGGGKTSASRHGGFITGGKAASISGAGEGSV